MLIKTVMPEALIIAIFFALASALAAAGLVWYLMKR